MLEVKVTVTLADEVLELISGLLQKASLGIQENSSKENKVIDPKQQRAGTKKDCNTVEEERAKEADICVGSLLDLAKQLIAMNKRDAVKKILSSLGVGKVTEVDKADYKEAYRLLLKAVDE